MAYAVYDPDSEKSLRQVDAMMTDGRIHMYGPANYKEDSLTYKWLKMKVNSIADSIVKRRIGILSGGNDSIPCHLVEEMK